MTRAAVVIPNWNGAKELERCLESLSGQAFKNFSVTVVDNGSSDNSLEVVGSSKLSCEVIKFDRNYGFSKAVNAGIRAADAEYIVLLNNDTEQHPEWLAELIKAMDEHPEYAMAASKSVLFNRRDAIDTAGDGMSLYGLGYAIGNGRLAGEFSAQTEVFGASAGSAIYRQTFFDRVGLFDERFFAYAEDLDLCYRAQLLGCRCLFVASAVVYHDQGSTSRRKPGMAEYYTSRNVLMMQVKNIPATLYWPNLHKIIFGQLAWLLSGRDYQRMYWVIKGWLAFLVCMPYALRSRMAIQRSAVVSPADLSDRLIPCFPFDSKVIKMLKKLRLVSC